MVASLRGVNLRSVRISQGAAPPPVLLGPSTFRMYTNIQTLTYITEYQAATSGGIDLYYDSASQFDPGNVWPDSFELSNADTEVSFYAGATGAARSIYTIVDSSDNSYNKCAFEVVVGGGDLSISVVQSFPDPSLFNGGASSYITYDPTGSIYGIDPNANAIGPASVAPFTEGDIIGVVQDVNTDGYGDSYFWFFKNGILQYSSSQILSFYAAIAVVTQP